MCLVIVRMVEKHGRPIQLNRQRRNFWLFLVIYNNINYGIIYYIVIYIGFISWAFLNVKTFFNALQHSQSA